MIARLFAMILLSTSCALAQSQPAPQDTQGKGDKAEPQQVQTVAQPTPPVTVSVSPTFVANSPTDRQQDNNQGTDADWAMVRWTAVATVVGFILAAIAGVQLRAQTKQTSEALKYAAEGLDETRKAAVSAQQAERVQAAQNEALMTHVASMAKAADASAASARTAMYLQLRARLGLQSITVTDFKPGSHTPLAKFVFKNFGGKGAAILERSISARVGDSLDSIPTYPSWLAMGVPVEAGDVHEGFLNLPAVSDELWQQLQAGTKKAWIIGALRYNVGFNRVKTLRFCRVYDPILSERLGESFFGVDGGAEYNKAE